MYTSYFGLREKPFSITPDPRFLYLSERHAEALAHLQYGVLESGGFIQLTGEVGTGKTTVMRVQLAKLPEQVEVAAILNPQVDLIGFLRTICHEFGITPAEQDHKSLLDALNAHLLLCHAKGKRAVLVIDEAQNLDRSVLEQIRLLTNLETETAKLLQIILIGQPELRETLARTDLRQLAQRITGRYHLGPLSAQETADYVRHRLDVAGATTDIFAPAALREVHRVSGGVPRLVNVVCDRALLGAYSKMERQVSPRLVRRASEEVQGPRINPRDGQGPGWVPLAAAAGMAAVATGLGGWWLANNGAPLPPNAVAETREARVALEPSPPPTADAFASAQTDSTRSATAIDTSDPVAAAEQAPPAPSLDELLVTYASETTTARAFDALFARWGLPGVALDQEPCDWARRERLRCEVQLGSWALLEAMNRPAILSLVDLGGERHHVVATRLEAGEIDLLIGDESYTLALNDVTPRWMGEYLLLWRPHPDADGLLRPGSRGPGVAWLRESLTSLSGESLLTSGSTTPDLYDSALTAQVRDFQREARLTVDGLAGLHTLIVLNAALEPDGVPTLSDSRATDGTSSGDSARFASGRRSSPGEQE
ncbi:MAG: AAA family ATPase [Pseudomonadota bacterium]